MKLTTYLSDAYALSEILLCIAWSRSLALVLAAPRKMRVLVELRQHEKLDENDFNFGHVTWMDHEKKTVNGCPCVLVLLNGPIFVVEQRVQLGTFWQVFGSCMCGWAFTKIFGQSRLGNACVVATSSTQRKRIT